MKETEAKWHEGDSIYGQKDLLTTFFSGATFPAAEHPRQYTSSQLLAFSMLLSSDSESYVAGPLLHI